ncbi:MAG: hypothetical protein SFU83_04500 [Meiothermus sp.]|nr:hypothetical protein [Meiothermus sp.]
MSEKKKPVGALPSQRGVWLRAGLLALALLMVLLLLAAYRNWLVAPTLPQALDPRPREFTLPDYLPEGQAQARFDLYSESETGPGRQSKQSGLVVRWGYENKGFWQIIASCREVRRGVPGEFGGRVLDIARCDGQTFTLVAEGRGLQIRRGGVDAGAVMWQQALPEGFVSRIVREQE